MSSSLSPDGSASFSTILGRGAAIGIAGGLAEVVVVALYSSLANVSVAYVGRQIASAVNLDGTDAWTGLAVHMTLAVVLGIGLMAAWSAQRRGAGARSLYMFTMLALAAVWGINFFVVLPALSPGFVTLLPYSVTLLSKLMFGFAAGVSIQVLSDARFRSTFPVGEHAHA